MAISDLADEVFDAIRAYLEPRWTHCPIAWPNEPFGNADGEAFVAVELHSTSYGQQSIGAVEQADNRWDEDGTLWFHITVPRNSGFSPSRGAARALANLFRGTTLLNDRLEFGDAVLGHGQDANQEGTKFVTSVSIEWRLMEA